jgi:hypothetical protein
LTTTGSDEVGLTHGFRSGLEVAVASQIERANLPVCYEGHRLSYLKPSRPSKYTPDFILPNGIVIETKGRFLTVDRQKHRLIQEQHPNLDLRFVFSNPKTRISKTSSTTYAMWCDRYNFQWAKLWIPVDWLREPQDLDRITATQRILQWMPPTP